MREAQNSRKKKPKGLYLHGGPGTGCAIVHCMCLLFDLYSILLPLTCYAASHKTIIVEFFSVLHLTVLIFHPAWS